MSWPLSSSREIRATGRGTCPQTKTGLVPPSAREWPCLQTEVRNVLTKIIHTPFTVNTISVNPNVAFWSDFTVTMDLFCIVLLVMSVVYPRSRDLYTHCHFDNIYLFSLQQLLYVVWCKKRNNINANIHAETIF